MGIFDKKKKDRGNTAIKLAMPDNIPASDIYKYEIEKTKLGSVKIPFSETERALLKYMFNKEFPNEISGEEIMGLIRDIDIYTKDFGQNTKIKRLKEKLTL
jgi:transcription antitermination factor NusA-like protein